MNKLPQFANRCLKRTLTSSVSLPVLFEKQGSVGTILLNRPRTLNAYNHEMVELLVDKLYDYEQDKDVQLVLMAGSGDRAFCAGGDIVHLGNIAFENQLHHKIKTFSKPIVSIGDRIVMGGGMGLCCNSRYRVGTERSVFAMPETRIGFFPDAGASYFLSRLDHMGMYLALTGYRTKGYLAKHFGFTTHYVESNDLGALRNDILNCSSEKDLKDCLDSSHRSDEISEFTLLKHESEISACFSAPSVLEIMNRLQASKSEFARDTLEILSMMCPTALCITHKMQLLCRDLTYTKCLEMEVDVSEKTFALGEFREGVRALLIDKDNQPKWNPSSVELVDQDIIDDCFNLSVGWKPLP